MNWPCVIFNVIKDESKRIDFVGKLNHFDKDVSHFWSLTFNLLAVQLSHAMMYIYFA